MDNMQRAMMRTAIKHIDDGMCRVGEIRQQLTSELIRIDQWVKDHDLIEVRKTKMKERKDELIAQLTVLQAQEGELNATIWKLNALIRGNHASNN